MEKYLFHSGVSNYFSNLGGAVREHMQPLRSDSERRRREKMFPYTVEVEDKNGIISECPSNSPKNSQVSSKACE